MIIKAWEAKIALRYFITKKKDQFISIINIFSIIGIALGVATLIIVMSVMNGYEKELINKILLFNGHINIVNIQSTEEAEDMAAKINGLSNIKSTEYISEMQAMAGYKSKILGTVIKGVSPDYLKSLPLISSSHLKDGLVLGKELARQLGVSVGDEVKIISPQFSQSITGPIPKILSLTVVGTVDFGMHEYNSTFSFTTMKNMELFYKEYEPDDSEEQLSIMEDFPEASQHISTSGSTRDNVPRTDSNAAVPSEHAIPSEFSQSKQTYNIEIRLDDYKNTQKILQHLRKLLPYEVGIINWESSNQSLSQALKIERTVMFLILSLIILIAAFNIISGLVILVKDKSKDIAILTTMGASKLSIIKIFIMSGFAIGLIGTMVGTVAGITFTLNIDSIRLTLERMTDTTIFDPVVYFLTSLPFELQNEQIILVCALSLLLSLAATIYPAVKISNISPADVLRQE